LLRTQRETIRNKRETIRNNLVVVLVSLLRKTKRRRLVKIEEFKSVVSYAFKIEDFNKPLSFPSHTSCEAFLCEAFIFSFAYFLRSLGVIFSFVCAARLIQIFDLNREVCEGKDKGFA